MPIYEYMAVDPKRSCEYCRERFEAMQSMKDEPLQACPHCGNPVDRVISSCGISTHSEKNMLSDNNLKRLGFKKLVNEGDGKFRNVL